MFNQGARQRVRHFSCKFQQKMALVTCPCAFRLRRLAQKAGSGIRVRHFLVNFHKKKCFSSPQNCVGFLFLDLYRVACHLLLLLLLLRVSSYTLSHTTLSHTNCRTILSHTTLSPTTLSHTTLSHPLCHIHFVTHNFVTHTHNFVIATLSHPLCHIHIVTCTLSHTHKTLSPPDIHRRFRWPAWHLVKAPSFCVASVALGDIHCRFAWQACYLWKWAGSGGALCPAGASRYFAWQAWHLATSAFVSGGRRGTWRHPLSFFVAGVLLMGLGWLW